MDKNLLGSSKVNVVTTEDDNKMSVIINIERYVCLGVSKFWTARD